MTEIKKEEEKVEGAACPTKLIFFSSPLSLDISENHCEVAEKEEKKRREMPGKQNFLHPPFFLQHRCISIK